MEGLYQLKVHSRIHKLQNNIAIGSMPPHALIIEDAPEYLSNVLRFFSSKKTIKEAEVYLSDNTNLSSNEINLLLGDLIENEIIVKQNYDSNNRYSRHSLYYEMIDANAENAQKILAEKTVGLVGMGGIGSNVAMNLAAAGVGKLIFSDGDTIELSNLTRQYLYKEDQVGLSKVESAKEQLQLLNSEVELIPVCESISGEELFDNHFSECDFVVLSADSPFFVHEWINNAALKYGFSYSNAGYIETYGAIGPLVIPGETACYECYKDKGDLYLYSDNKEEFSVNLNESFQAPSYGPLNAMVSSIQANEVIRHLLGLKTKTSGKRLLINSEIYKIHEENFEKKNNCLCSDIKGEKLSKNTLNSDKELHEVYIEERESDSFNSILLDKTMSKLVKINKEETKILDIGCATGEQALYFANKGAKVTAVDISDDMLKVLDKKASNINAGSIKTMRGNIESIEVNDTFNYIVCNNILDYLPEIDRTLRKLNMFLKNDGTLIVTIPHPVKDGGGWRKDYYNGKWNYEEFILKDYFNEGLIEKSREDKNGETVIKSIKTYHRTTETYFNSFTDAGFKVVSLLEPQPLSTVSETHPILFEKCSRIPYFQVFVLKKEDRNAI
ncbi:ThiF family adenylyltransferase [Bacillus amyloliquefaciens]|uniref:ThiF family adenylyltransferase n=1 Tax=Bacillus amyloliquefaciens TaxID=1390 RepID=UPI003D2209B1